MQGNVATFLHSKDAHRCILTGTIFVCTQVHFLEKPDHGKILMAKQCNISHFLYNL